MINSVKYLLQVYKHIARLPSSRICLILSVRLIKAWVVECFCQSQIVRIYQIVAMQKIRESLVLEFFNNLFNIGWKGYWSVIWEINSRLFFVYRYDFGYFQDRVYIYICIYIFIVGIKMKKNNKKQRNKQANKSNIKSIKRKNQFNLKLTSLVWNIWIKLFLKIITVIIYSS